MRYNGFRISKSSGSEWLVFAPNGEVAHAKTRAQARRIRWIAVVNGLLLQAAQEFVEKNPA